MSTYKTLNSPLELGTRISLLLSVLKGRQTLDDLVMLDYALLYSEEFGGPENLHPALPNHIAEIAYRREVLPEALNLFVRRGLIGLSIDSTGYYYSSNESTFDFIACLQSEYYKKSWVRLNWIAENASEISKTNLTNISRS